MLLTYTGDAPLHLAARHNYLEVVKLLVHAEANVNVQHGVTGMTALHIASSFGHIEVVKFLVNAAAADKNMRQDSSPSSN